MKLIRVGAAVLNQTPLDWRGNQDNIVGAIRKAKSQGITLLCLPELCITGYGCEDAFHSPATQKMAWKILQNLLPETKGMIVALGLPIFHQNALFNAAALVVDGAIRGLVAKQHLAGDGIHYEPRWFKPWTAGVTSTYTAEGLSIPLGDIHFDCGGIKIGFEICEDAWVVDRPGNSLALNGVDMILNPSASHFAFHKINVRKRFVLEGSRSFGVSYLYANLLGNEAGRAIYDGGALIASAGKMLAEGRRFSFSSFEITEALIDVESTRMNQARVTSFQPQVEKNPHCILCPFEFPAIIPENIKKELSSWEESRDIKEEEFFRAVTLALFDFMRKSHSHGFVVSLSGGADSTAVSLLVGLMIQSGVQELGFEEFQRKISYIPGIDLCQNSSELIHRLLTCVYQSTRNSSKVTQTAASEVAAMMGADFFHLDVDSLVQNYTEIIEKALGRKLSWKEDDVTLQNIQARVRAPSVWMLANVRRALLLATSNRSEAAVGYATMDGDTCGGLSPIAGIDKAFLRRWLVWMEKEGPVGFQPLSGLKIVTAQEPTAELKPHEYHQTDEEDLMPYDVLDKIERAAIRDKQSPLEVYLLMRANFPQFTASELGKWVERFFRLWCRNQWKRERYAPSFHLDDENLDPKTWCRFPILSGGYELELEEFRNYLSKNK